MDKLDKQCKKNKIGYERFPAYDGKKLKDYKQDIDKYFVKKHNLSTGQIGCALSHIKIWEKILENNYKNVLILEDDATVPDNFWEQINNLNVKEFDILYLQLSNIVCKKQKGNIHKVVKSGDSNWGTTAYIVNKEFVKKMIDVKIRNPVDIHLSNFYNSNVLLVYPNIIKPDLSSRSDLWGGIPNDINMSHIFDKIKFV
jgi:glycosyl transferase family 25